MPVLNRRVDPIEVLTQELNRCRNNISGATYDETVAKGEYEIARKNRIDQTARIDALEEAINVLGSRR